MGDILSTLLCSDEGGSATGHPFGDWLVESFVCGDE
jgi:hypothetical protein